MDSMDDYSYQHMQNGVPYDGSVETSWAIDTTISPLSGNTQVTTKIPPSYDGRRLWFTYENEVEDWCDITELSPEKRGPALRNR